MRDVIKCVGWENCHVNCVGSYRPLVLLICWWGSEEEFTIDLNVIHCKCSNSESLLKVTPGFMCSHVACWRISKTRLSWTRVKLTFANTPTHLAKALSSFPFSSLLGYAGDVQYIPPSSSSEDESTFRTLNPIINRSAPDSLAGSVELDSSHVAWLRPGHPHSTPQPSFALIW